jgi:hypothetical protein
MRHGDRAGGGSLAALELGPAGEVVAHARRLWPPAEAAGAGARVTLSSAGDPACTSPPEPERFAPHGLAVGATESDGETPVAVVGHGVREAVELFALRGEGGAATLRWTGCIPLPEGAIGNDVWLDAGGDLWVTNYQPALRGPRGLYYTILGGLGLPTGEVLRWRSARWESIAGTGGANPNGLLVLPAGEALAIAFTGSSELRLLPLTSAGAPAGDIALGARPDNLSLGSRATLLAPVHTSGLAFLRCRFGALPCASPWKLLEIDPATGAASERLSHDGSRLGGVSSAAEVGERIYLGAVFDDRIGVLLR